MISILDKAERARAAMRAVKHDRVERLICTWLLGHAIPIDDDKTIVVLVTNDDGARHTTKIELADLARYLVQELL